jgi:hypothetical protein
MSAQTALSMLPWQWLHASTSVLDMRTIVECSPQFGQTDTSSKRWRQFTQRYRPGTALGRSHGSPQLGHSGPSFTEGSLTGMRLTAHSAHS